MNKYQDSYTMYHDKPANGKRVSNNSYIYTAYARHILPETINMDKVRVCYRECLRHHVPLKMDRSPSAAYPPLSKDEVIGAVSLGLLSHYDLEQSHWNLCNLEYEPKKLTLFDAFKAAKILFSIRKEHRNYVWVNELKDAYPLAFYLGPEDQYYVNKLYDKPVTLLQTIFFWINAVQVLTGSNKSAKMFMWLKLADLKHPLLRFTKKEAYINDYFEDGHIFREGL